MLADRYDGRHHAHVVDPLLGASGDGTPPPRSLPDVITGLEPRDSAPGAFPVERSLSPSENGARFRGAALRESIPPQLSQPILDTEIFEAVAPLAPKILSAITAAPAPLRVQVSGSNLAFSITWDTSVASAPAGFSAMIGSVAQLLAKNLTSTVPVTINLQVGWGTINNSALPTGALGASSNYLYSFGSGPAAYGAFRSNLALVNSGSVIDKQILASAIPSSSPVGAAGGVYFTSAQAKAIRAISGIQPSLDGFVGFANTSYLQTSGSGYDLIGVAEHELTEAMGRIMLSGTKFSTTTRLVSGFTSEDLMHFSAPGARMLTTKGGYLSADGTSKLAYLNGQASGDAADLASPTTLQPNLGRDALNAFAYPGATTLSSNAWFTMDALGWNLNPASGLTGQSVPTYLA